MSYCAVCVLSVISFLLSLQGAKEDPAQSKEPTFLGKAGWVKKAPSRLLASYKDRFVHVEKTEIVVYENEVRYHFCWKGFVPPHAARSPICTNISELNPVTVEKSYSILLSLNHRKLPVAQLWRQNRPLYPVTGRTCLSCVAEPAELLREAGPGKLW